MGADGHGPFDNDDAMDWVAELAEADDESVLAEALEAVSLDADEYVDATDASVAVAAAEVVAALLDQPADELPEEVWDFVERQRGVKPSLVKLARKAVTRVLKDSELRELWEESDGFEAWKDSLEDLLSRL
jgi:hypothetical protein